MNVNIDLPNTIFSIETVGHTWFCLGGLCRPCVRSMFVLSKELSTLFVGCRSPLDRHRNGAAGRVNHVRWQKAKYIDLVFRLELRRIRDGST